MNIARLILGSLGAILLLAVLWFSAVMGALFNVLFMLLLTGCGIGIMSRVVGIVRRDISLRLIREPGSVEARPYWGQLAIRCAFWILAGMAVHIAILPAQFDAATLLMIRSMLWLAVALLVAMSVVPLRFIYWPVNAAFALAAIVLSWQLVVARSASPPANAVELAPPTPEPWLVFHGTGAFLTNHHHFAGSQKHAVDTVPEVDGLLIGEADLSKYAAFGADVLSPCDGEVVAVENTQPDQAIGGSDPSNPAGNYITIRKAEGVYVLLAHLKKGSAQVTVGDRVVVGQKLGLCGNSGNTSQPHIHLQAMTGPDLFGAASEALPISINGAIPRRNDQF